MDSSPSSHSDPCLYFPQTSSTADRATNSDEDVQLILSASRPKKRAGRKKFKETRHPVYRGVRLRNSNKWVCELREPTNQKRIWLGTYPTPEMAARAHDIAALALRGQMACLNFADSAWRLPIPVSKDAKDLRKAAMEAAVAFQEEVAMQSKGEEEDWNMARLAEGVLLSPPPCLGWRLSSNDVESDAEVELYLWSF